MYNDVFAFMKFEEFQARYRFNTIIETGTHRGQGAIWFSRYRAVVCTIESNERYRDIAKLNFMAERWHYIRDDEIGGFPFAVFNREGADGKARTICSFLGSSPEVLDAMFTYRRALQPPFLFYLDAHWFGNWPVLDELRIIAKHNLSDSCIIIHDFQVPGKPFGYDEHEGQALNLDYVREDLFRINPRYMTFYNDKACADERGRGILYVVPPD